MLSKEKRQELLQGIRDAQKVLIGIGPEWRLSCEEGTDIRACSLMDAGQTRLREGYECLFELIKDKDYFVVTTLTDGAIYDTSIDPGRVTAPCGNVHWRQCSRACTKDIWEEYEVPEDVCPHCGAPLTGNTIRAERYIEEGYLPSWKAYMKWQTETINRSLVILELGEGFQTPTVMRWPFEKVVFFNRKAHLYRVNEALSQIPKEVEERAEGIRENSVDLIRGLAIRGSCVSLPADGK